MITRIVVLFVCHTSKQSCNLIPLSKRNITECMRACSLAEHHDAYNKSTECVIAKLNCIAKSVHRPSAVQLALNRIMTPSRRFH